MQTRQTRTLETLTRRMIVQGKPAEQPDLNGHCNKCKLAYIIGLDVYKAIVATAVNNKTLLSNLDMKFTHRTLPGYSTIDGIPRIVSSQVTHEHMIVMYSQNDRDYLMNAGVQVKVPRGKHHIGCQYTWIDIDIPVRLKAKGIIHAIAEQAILRTIETVQAISQEGITVVDQRRNGSTIEHRIKIVLGPLRVPMIPDPGFIRTATIIHNHGFPIDDRTPRQPILGLPEEDSTAQVTIPMEIDPSSQEAEKLLPTLPHGSTEEDDQ